jgi:RiboL-PSP-HEPN
MPSHARHMAALVENVKEVDRLSGIHSKITKKGPGRKHKVGVLHKSSVVLLVACWEAFIEDLASSALEHMIATCKDHKVFPPSVLERVASAHQGPKAWDLAGEGWKTSLRDNMTAVLAKTTGSLNTPKTAQVDELFVKVLGAKDISATWKWKGRSSKQAAGALDALVTLRGAIAHRVSAAKAVSLKDVHDARSLIFRLAVRSHNEVCAFLLTTVGSSQWKAFHFEGTY